MHKSRQGDRPLILYAYAESETARKNLDFFVQKGLHGKADFIFVFNGPTNATDMIRQEPNIRIVKRENECFDLGGMGEVLKADDLWKKYKRFITMNASLRGPFYPAWVEHGCWSDRFLERITDTVKVSAPSPIVSSLGYLSKETNAGCAS